MQVRVVPFSVITTLAVALPSYVTTSRRVTVVAAWPSYVATSRLVDNRQFLSDVVFGGRRKIVMAIFSVMAAISSVVLAWTGPETPRVVLLVTLVVAGVSAIG